MRDLTDLPLFSGVPAAEPLRSKKHCRERHNRGPERVAPGADPLSPSATGSALVLPFPPSRDTRLIADLVQAFLNLRQRHGRRCRSLLIARRFKPIAGQLRKMGVPAASVEHELAQLEAAVARSVWRCDGCPSTASSGGHAA
ncbi:DUF6074 family protein [Methylobacterium sp. J-090]|uniref:DUF6074 family protein n=1 Tax=Methylobacterium sp. J-090 TaxID=2836666 RepID=UPI001FBA6982|nr:DUF6074 family protein [Methylobacterium sp. J-090]MCJ2083222.1 DUF6074 family protein [Methylobacterium sp. J-090]